jgi:hypothetical protein
MTDAEILTLVERFERCLLGKNEFPHRHHLAVAALYLFPGDFESAMDRMRASLQRFAAHHGVSGLYHETLTRFWLLQVNQRLDRSVCLSSAVSGVIADLNDKNLTKRFYSEEVLKSQEAREGWVEPDLIARQATT